MELLHVSIGGGGINHRKEQIQFCDVGYECTIFAAQC